MSMDALQVGDVVALHAGGPSMTVQARSMNLAYCAWMVEGRLHQGTFDIASLRRVRSAGTPSLGGASEFPDSLP